MAFHVHLRVQHGRGIQCELFVGCLDKDRRLVRTDMEGYSAGGKLMNIVRVTSENDDQEWEDLVLFLPYPAFNVVPGKHAFVALFGVGRDGKDVTEKPVMVPFTIRKGK